MPPDALTHHDTGAKYLQVRNLRIATSGLDYSINYPARPLDPSLQYVPFREKQYYIDGQQRIYLQWPIFLGCNAYTMEGARLLGAVRGALAGGTGRVLGNLLAGSGCRSSEATGMAGHTSARHCHASGDLFDALLRAYPGRYARGAQPALRAASSHPEC